MNQRLSNLLQDWALRDSATGDDILMDQSTIQYLARTLFDHYEPSQFVQFDERLDRWLHNLTNERDQQTLFRLLTYLFFVGRSEFESLCRAAYNGPLRRWLVEQIDLDIADPSAMSRLDAAVADTWFCPITDSMRINSFLKVNHLTGKPDRPDWRSLKKLGDPNKIRQFMADNRIRNIVLLEDFVGTGSQMRDAVEFAGGISAQVPVLALPLVACPCAEQLGRRLAAAHANVSYTSVVPIAPKMLLKADPQSNEPPLFEAVRELIGRVKRRLKKPARDPKSRRYHGYKGTGAVFAMYSNCPNNSLPIIHDDTSKWQALFPRIKRT